MKQKQFAISDYVTFNEQGRALCPSCQLVKGSNYRKLNLSLLDSGAYHCHRGCTTDEIRAALGVVKEQIVPTALAKSPSSITISPQKVREAHDQLMSRESSKAKEWLTQRGITEEMISHYRLGVARSKVTDEETKKTHWFPSISIPIPANADRTAYYQKKRVAPWTPETEMPNGYKRWSQYGIPATVWFTHKPENAYRTFLCEGEWDAMLLGYLAHKANRTDVAIATFTCGCCTVPQLAELEQMPGTVYIFYDRNDTPTERGTIPAEEGIKKVAKALDGRARVAMVPMPKDCQVAGWDVSDAINHGYTLDDFDAALEQAKEISIEVVKHENPLRSRLMTNAQLIDSAPDYVEWLVQDLLPANELILLAAGPRAGKSLLAMLLAKTVAMGEAFLDRPVIQGSVLYVRCEDAPVKIKQRQMAQGWPKDCPVYWLDRFKLSQTKQLKELAEELDVRLIVLDTLSRIRDDGTTESSAEMSRVIEPLQELAEDLNCSIVLVHHTGKVSVDNAGTIDVFDTIRGSSAIRATCRGSIVLAADSDYYRLCAENGYGKIDLKIRIDLTTLEWKLIGRWTEQVSSDLKTTVLDYFAQVGEATLEQIFEATQIPKSSLYKTLSRLVRDQMITKAGHRRQVLYKRSIGLIGQYYTLSDSSNADIGSAIDTYQTKNLFLFSNAESEQNSKSEHTTHAKDDNFPASAHFPEEGKNPLYCPMSVSNADGVSVSSSDNSSDKPDLSDEGTLSVQSDHHFHVGDRVEILTGQFAGRIVFVKGFTESGQVSVKSAMWIVTQEYSPSALRLLKKGGVSDANG